MRSSLRVNALLWAILIVFCVVPWYDLQTHAHWSRIRWLPLVSPPVRLTDILLNFLLYVPLGYWCSWDSTEPFGAARVAGYAALLSVLTEATQLFSHVRFPSVADVLCNLTGALCGGLLAAGFHRPADRSQPVLPDRFAGL